MPYKYIGISPEAEKETKEAESTPVVKEKSFKYLGNVSPEEDYEGLLPPRDIGRTAKVIGAHVVGLPGNIKKLLRTTVDAGVSYLTGREIPEKYKESEVDILPTTEEITKKSEEIFPSLAPKTAGEEKYEEELGTFVDLAMPLPGKKIAVGANIVRPFLGTTAGMAAETGSELANLPEPVKKGAKIISQILPMVVSGKLTPTTEEAKDLYKAGKMFGLTDEQLTPLLQPEGKLKTLSKAAKESTEIAKRMQDVEKKLGVVFEDVRKTGESLPPLSKQQKDAFLDKVESLVKDLKGTLNPSDEKKKAITFLTETIKNIKSGKAQITPSSLEKYYRDMNASVDWSKVGTKSLKDAKTIIKETFAEISPELSYKFEKANELYSRMKNFSEKVHWTKDLERNVFLSEGAALLGGLLTGNFEKAVVTIGTGEVARKIATKLLTDPKWQYITRNTVRAATKKSPKIANLAYNQLKEKVKEEFPVDYREIKWPE